MPPSMWKTRCVEIDRGTAASTATPRVVTCTVRQAFSVFGPGEFDHRRVDVPVLDRTGFAWAGRWCRP